MDVEGLNAAVLNPDLRLVNPAARKTPGTQAPLSLSSLPLSLTANALRLLIIHFRAGLIIASLTLAKVKVISATEQLAACGFLLTTLFLIGHF